MNTRFCIFFLFMLLALPCAGAFQENNSTTSLNISKTLNEEDTRLFRLAFNETNMEQLLMHVSKNNKVPLENLRISSATMFVYPYIGQNTTQYSQSLLERLYWVVKVQDIESNRTYEVYVMENGRFNGRIMTDEQSKELVLHYKKYGKMEWDVPNALANMKEDEKLDVIIYPVVIYTPDFNPLPESTIEYFIKLKYDFVVLKPLVYSANVSEDFIRELEKRDDIENVTIVEKVGNNTRIIIRIKPTGLDEQIMPLEEFLLNKSSYLAVFLKPNFGARGVTKDTVLELNNRTDVLSIALEHTYYPLGSQEDTVISVEKTPLVVESEQKKPELPVSTPAPGASPQVPGFEMVSGSAGILAVWWSKRKSK